MPISAEASIATAIRRGLFGDLPLEDCLKRFKKAVDEGLLKVMSKMGIAVVSSYRGGANFEPSASRARWCGILPAHAAPTPRAMPVRPIRRDARLHGREVFRHQRAREADGLEVGAAAIAADDGDCPSSTSTFSSPSSTAFLKRFRQILEWEIAEQAAAMAVGNGGLREIGIHRGGADADEDREMMDIQAIAAAHIERGEVRSCWRSRCVCTAPVARIIGIEARLALTFSSLSTTCTAPAAHGVLGLAAMRAMHPRSALSPPFGSKLPIDVDGGGAHIGAHGLELGRQQHRRSSCSTGTGSRPGRGCCRDCRAASSASSRALRVRSRSAGCDLAEVLPEIVMQAAILVRQHGDGRVVAHGADGFLGVLHHRMEDQLQVLLREPYRHLASPQLVLLEARGLAGL